MTDIDPLLEDDQWDQVNNRPKFANLCVKLIEQERRSSESMLSEAHRVFAERPPASLGTPWARDWELVQSNEFLEGALAIAGNQFQRLMLAALDYSESLIVLLKHDRLLVQPAWSAGRGLMEAVLLSCWILDATKSSEVRVARALSLLPSTFQGAINTLQKFPEQGSELAEKRQARGDLVAFYKKNGVEVAWKYDKQHKCTDTTNAVIFRGNKASFRHNVTQMAEWYLPDAPYLYPLLSGAAHSESWLLEGFNPSSAAEALSSVVMPLFAISLGYTGAVCSYFGIDPRPYVSANERRLKALVLRGGGRPKRKPDRQTAFGTLGSGFLEEFTQKSW